MEEPGFDELEKEASRLSEASRRGVLSLLSLCVGDSVGVNFELSMHRENRARADEAASRGAKELARFVLALRVQHLGTRGLDNAFARPFTDDTVCTDLKMAAIAECSELLQRPEFKEQEPSELMWKCMLSQMLAWSDGDARGALFQGYGGYTKGLLRPEGGPRGSGRVPCMTIAEDDLPGFLTWPEDWFVEHSELYCNGQTMGGVTSYGNGAVMSLAPQVLATAVAKVPPSMQSKAVLGRLADTHRSPEARAGAELLASVVRQVVEGGVRSCADLPSAVRRSESWQTLMAGPLADHPVYPLRAFDSFFQNGDCSEGDALAFVANLTRSEAPQMAPAAAGGYAGPGGGLNLGRLLRTAANWDDDHSKLSNERHITLDSGEDIRFSQRALNSVLVALWCSCGARTTWDWLARVIYVGGDADTVGAVCGQVVGPLIGAKDVFAAFRQCVALDTCSDLRPSALVAHAAARRYFLRATLFCAGRWVELCRYPRLVDPVYAGLTNELGTKLEVKDVVGLRVLWVDRAFDDHSLTSGRAGRAEIGRRQAVEEAKLHGKLIVRQATTLEDAQETLQMARHGVEGFELDAVVTEQQIGREDRGGLQLMHLIHDLWGDAARGSAAEPPRPLFCLLTPSWDSAIASEVRARPHAVMARHDRPDDILQKVMYGNTRRRAALPPKTD